MELTECKRKDRSRGQHNCLCIYLVSVYFLLSAVLYNVGGSEVTSIPNLTIDEDVVSCSSNPCENGGSCVQDINFVRCKCGEGFTGELCEIEIDKCASNPCENKGKCIDGINTYWCVCKEGFTGERCEEIDECASEPCENCSIFFDGKKGYRCECPKGFTEKLCEKEKHWCKASKGVQARNAAGEDELVDI